MKPKIEIIEIGDEEIVGIEKREIRVSISKLKDYLLERGFKHRGVWYFRKTWMNMNSNLFRLFESSGLVEKVGTPSDLKGRGIIVPDTLEYRGRGAPQIYRVINDKINSLKR